MKRILVEFYSQRPPENLISLLTEHYDGAYFLYFATENAPSPQKRQRITTVLNEVLNFSPVFVEVNVSTIEAVLETFSSIITKENQYEIDITGGNEIFIAAAGIFLSENAHISIHLHRYNIPAEKLLCRYPKMKKETPLFPKYLKVPQILSLGGTPALSAPRYQFSFGPLRSEILRLWNAVKSCPKDWNNYCSLPADPLGRKDAMTQKCIGTLQNQKSCYGVVAQRLKAAGIMKNERSRNAHGRIYMEFELDVPQEARFLYDKAGTLLEMYGALAAFDSDLFHDIRVGVTVDWNGSIAPQYKPDPRNELDLVLMRGNLPVMASCKNTLPENDYLYEISTMANHYGGHFATPMLLASGAASPTVRERAKEMGIILIDRIRTMPYERFVAELRHRFS